jgi:[ribosomal protein S5]-alanine N-acetyltransferase
MRNLTTNRLLLETLSEKDSAFILELLNTVGWIRFIGDRNVRTEADAKAYIQKINDTEDSTCWTVKLKDTNSAIGIITFIKRDYLKHHDIGFAFLPNFSNNGYAFEATQKVLYSINLNNEPIQILATTIPENVSSIRLLKKLGFRFDRAIQIQDKTLHIYKSSKSTLLMKPELKGSVKALLSEYKKAIDELITVIHPISEKQLSEVIDNDTTDLDCKSIQSILTHVVCSGYGYMIYIENFIGARKPRLEKVTFDKVNKYIEQLDLMFDYSINFFEENTSLQIEQIDNSKKISVAWGQQYDIEQLLEHAIVHILRHRRQIENFIKQQSKWFKSNEQLSNV